MLEIDIYSGQPVANELCLRDLTREGVASMLMDVPFLSEPAHRTSPVMLVETASGDRIVAYPHGTEAGEQLITPWG